MPKNSGFFFLAQVVLTILCLVSEARTALFGSDKTKQKKETSEKSRGTWNLSRTSSGNLKLFKNLP